MIGKKYKILALFGKSGAGKNYLLDKIYTYPIFNKIISLTTRPPREHEEDGVQYHFVTVEDFTRQLLTGSLIEATEFNSWFYGTPIKALRTDKINIGIFNITAIEALLQDPRLIVQPVCIHANDKERLIRQLNREQLPNCLEICRRFQEDEKDFCNVLFSYVQIKNDNSASIDPCDQLEQLGEMLLDKTV